MAEADRNGGPYELGFEAYGLCLAVSTFRPDLLDRIREFLPPGWRPCAVSDALSRFELNTNDAGAFVLLRDNEELSGTQSVDLDLTLEILETELAQYLGTLAPAGVFIHAGAVEHRGRGIVIPAGTFAGKTTLVAALVSAGAVYYSDEFAVLDQRGLLQPYAKPLSLRDGGPNQTNHPVESFGGRAGDGLVPVGMIVLTMYQPGATWNPNRRSQGAGALGMLANALPAQDRPDEVMPAITHAAEDAIILEGDRGDADEIAPLLLAELERQIG